MFTTGSLSDHPLAGFGYTFFNNELRDYSKPIGYDEFSGHLKDIIQPLVHQPGEGWQYGVRGVVELETQPLRLLTCCSGKHRFRWVLRRTSNWSVSQPVFPGEHLSASGS